MVVVQQVQALETSLTVNVSTEEAISINISRLANNHQVIWSDSPTTKPLPPSLFVLISGALRENCATECNFLVPFMVINFLVVFVTFLLLIPMVVACLRSVRDSEHSLAIGLQVVCPCYDVKVCLVISLGSWPFPILQVCIARVIGSIPGPIAFGFFLDKTCVLWDQDYGRYTKERIECFGRQFEWSILSRGRYCLSGLW